MKRLKSPWKMKLVGAFTFISHGIEHGIRGCPLDMITEYRSEYGFNIYPYSCSMSKGGCGRLYSDLEMKGLKGESRTMDEST